MILNYLIQSGWNELETSNSDLSGQRLERLRAALLDMPMPFLYSLADKYDVEISPETFDVYSVVESFLDELSPEARKEILSQYGDAGKASSFVFMTRKKNPSIPTVYQKAKALLETKAESQFWESNPYYDEVEIDNATRSLRIRFHYLLGSIPYIDETTGRPKEHRLYWRGVVVYRPDCKLLEIRAKHRSMATKMSARIPSYLGLDPHYGINLTDERMNKKFVEWISSLNSATIELPISEVSGSLIITARKGMDLRTAKRYHEELKYGRLRHGHVTIKPEEEHKINFHIYFRNCHLKYTLLTSEADMEYVINALEKICEGFMFEKPERMLTQYFDKKT